jgi:2-polyprenyl-6-methoxyphenol hydroxylase-like FAD-dependent oxidoreductase
MRFVVAGGGVAGLAAAIAAAQAGHEAVVLERDAIEPGAEPMSAFEDDRRGIPHFFQPHAFLPRGRRVLADLAPDVLDALLEAGAEPQDAASTVRAREPGDEDLVYLWVRRPVIEWACVAQPRTSRLSSFERANESPSSSSTTAVFGAPPEWRWRAA